MLIMIAQSPAIHITYVPLEKRRTAITLEHSHSPVSVVGVDYAQLAGPVVACLDLE